MVLTGNDFDPKAREEHLFTVLSSNRFLKMEGIGREVPFFINPYPPAVSTDMDQIREGLKRRLENLGIRIADVNLYDLSIGILHDRGIFDQVVENEGSFDKAELLETFQGVLDPAEHLIPAITRELADGDHRVLFLSGIGEVYPYIRAHSILNNLQSAVKAIPTLLFFPGTYTQTMANGASLVLFGREDLHDDKYYRAFNILYCQGDEQ
ncbi:DUF1788 domain-containing protein [Siculibacillus lacustris]|uniref:DUF1788 domain-containing protein n=1 Tax=Siculibacillus lacustris TaxID=1549641 RepID=A0A4Q9VFY7_9HYPH|nr:DUF1788 domain-containing protein [Siculibacillus lacustris]TBW32925.1 DUF1788 domain-containing protein [Siculibacillus lacustris]